MTLLTCPVQDNLIEMIVFSKDFYPITPLLMSPISVLTSFPKCDMGVFMPFYKKEN